LLKKGSSLRPCGSVTFSRFVVKIVSVFTFGGCSAYLVHQIEKLSDSITKGVEVSHKTVWK